MKKRLILAVCLLACTVAAQSPKAIKDATPPKAAPVIKPITPDLADTYSQAQANLLQRQRELEQSAIYQAYLAAQAQERAAFFYVKSEVGAGKDCQPTFDKEKRLTGFACESK